MTASELHRIDALHVSTVHKPDDVRIYAKECVSLAGIGFSIGWLYCGDSKSEGRIDGIAHYSVPRVAGGRLSRFILQPWKMLSEIVRIRPKLTHLHDPELIPLGIVLKMLGYCVVYDAHEELDQQVLTKPYIPASLRPAISKLAKILMRATDMLFDAVVAATPHIAKVHGRSPKTVLVRNLPLLQDFDMPDRAHEVVKVKNVVYAGGLTRIRGIMELVLAMEFVADDVRLVLLGSFEPGLLEEVQTLPGWQKVDYRGLVKRKEVAKIASDCIAGLVTFLPVPNHVDAMPNKLFEYMAAGIAVIASNFAAWQEIVEGSKAGICVDPSNPRAIGAAIDRLCNDPELAHNLGKNGQQIVYGSMNWEAEFVGLANLYKSLLGT